MRLFLTLCVVLIPNPAFLRIPSHPYSLRSNSFSALWIAAYPQLIHSLWVALEAGHKTYMPDIRVRLSLSIAPTAGITVLMSQENYDRLNAKLENGENPNFFDLPIGDHSDLLDEIEVTVEDATIIPPQQGASS